MYPDRMLREFAERGRDVWAYEPAGGGRSDSLPLAEYTVDRSARDLLSVAHRVPTQAPIDIVGFSAGASVLARALTMPGADQRVRRAVFAEPGPVDGPAAAEDGARGRPNARGLAHPDLGTPATALPRYAVAFGLVGSGLLPPENGLLGQNEAVNAFGPAELAGDTAGAYCAADANRIPIEDSSTYPTPTDVPSFLSHGQ